MDTEKSSGKFTVKVRRMSHYEFFLYVFANLENLKKFLLSILPKAVLDEIVLKTLSFGVEKSVSNKLGIFLYDLVATFKTEDGGVGKIVILIEHKSHYDRFTLSQMLKYVTSCWYADETSTSGDASSSFDPVIPVLFFHGEHSWNPSNSLEMCFSEEMRQKRAIMQFTPKLDYVLCDLNTIDVEELDTNIEVLCALTLMKNVHKDLLKGFNRAVEFIESYISKKSLDDVADFVIAMFSYVMDSSNVDVSDVNKAISRINNSELKGAFMTLEEQLLEKGKAEGKAEGREEGREEGERRKAIIIAKKMLTRGDTYEDIAYLTGLSVEEIEQLEL